MLIVFSSTFSCFLSKCNVLSIDNADFKRSSKYSEGTHRNVNKFDRRISFLDATKDSLAFISFAITI